MYTTSVIPIVPGIKADVLTYFSDKKYSYGDIISCPFRNKKILSIVIDSSSIKDSKSLLKSADFEVKKINNLSPLLKINEDYLSSILKWADLYGESYTTIAKLLFPSSFIDFISINNQVALPSDVDVHVFPNHKELYAESLKYSEAICLSGQLSKKAQLDSIGKLFSQKKPKLFCTPQFLSCAINTQKITVHSYLSKDYFNISKPFISFVTLFKIIKESNQKVFFIDVLHDINTKEITFDFVDMTKSETGTKYFWQSNVLESKLFENKRKNIKTVLYLSRKGLASSTVCLDCKEALKCSTCLSLLSLHESQNNKMLSCNFCGTDINLEKDFYISCPKCSGHRFETFGTTTGRVFDDLCKKFDDIFLLDRDSARTNKKYLEILSDFNKTKNGILITTYIPSENLVSDADVVIVSLDSMFGIPFYDTDIQILRTIIRLALLNKEKQTLIQTRLFNTKLYQEISTNDISNVRDAILDKIDKSTLPPKTVLLELAFKKKLTENDALMYKSTRFTCKKYKNLWLYYVVYKKDVWGKDSIEILENIRHNNKPVSERVHIL